MSTFSFFTSSNATYASPQTEAVLGKGDQGPRGSGAQIGAVLSCAALITEVEEDMEATKPKSEALT